MDFLPGQSKNSLFILERVMDKLSDMEVRLTNKVNVKEIEEMKSKVEGLVCSVKDELWQVRQRLHR